MTISQAGPDDVRQLARLQWLDTIEEEPTRPSLDEFAAELDRWWAPRRDSHVAYVARLDRPEIVGVAWIALLPRVPRPGASNRLSADLQSVFVLPSERGHGIGSALIQAAAEHATRLGAQWVTVHPGRRAIPVYERLGFRSSPQLLHRAPD